MRMGKTTSSEKLKGPKAENIANKEVTAKNATRLGQDDFACWL